MFCLFAFFCCFNQVLSKISSTLQLGTSSVLPVQLFRTTFSYSLAAGATFLFVEGTRNEFFEYIFKLLLVFDEPMEDQALRETLQLTNCQITGFGQDDAAGLRYGIRVVVTAEDVYVKVALEPGKLLLLHAHTSDRVHICDHALAHASH